jgi:hypothetical protein
VAHSREYSLREAPDQQNQDNLAVDRFDYPETGVDNGGSLIFTPISALPPHSLLDRNLIPTGEPVTELTAVHLSLRWSFADNRGRKRRVNVEELFSFEALFGDPDTPQESQSVPEDPKPGQDIDMEAEALAQVGLGMQKVMRLQLIR